MTLQKPLVNLTKLISTFDYTLVFSVTGEDDDDAAFEAPKIYEPIENLEQLSARLKMQMGLYNEAIRGAAMDLVFFNV